MRLISLILLAGYCAYASPAFAKAATRCRQLYRHGSRLQRYCSTLSSDWRLGDMIVSNYLKISSYSDDNLLSIRGSELKAAINDLNVKYPVPDYPLYILTESVKKFTGDERVKSVGYVTAGYEDVMKSRKYTLPLRVSQQVRQVEGKWIGEVMADDMVADIVANEPFFDLKVLENHKFLILWRYELLPETSHIKTREGRMLPEAIEHLSCARNSETFAASTIYDDDDLVPIGFHGTSLHNLIGIRNLGIIPSSKGILGRGFYVTPDFDEALDYAARQAMCYAFVPKQLLSEWLIAAFNESPSARIIESHDVVILRVLRYMVVSRHNLHHLRVVCEDLRSFQKGKILLQEKFAPYLRMSLYNKHSMYLDTVNSEK